MEKNKITMSLGTFIVIIILITVLIIGGIFLGYKYIKKQAQDQNVQAEKTQDKNIFDDIEEYTKPASENKNNSQTNDKDTQKEDTSKNTQTNDRDNKKEDTSLPANNNLAGDTSKNKPNTKITGKKSSVEAPLEIGEWGIASYYVENKQYTNIPVKINNIIRGNVATQKIKDFYNKKGPNYKVEEAKEGMEWTIIECTIDQSSLEKKDGYLPNISVKGIDGSGLYFGGHSYITIGYELKDLSKTLNQDIVESSYAIQLPIGCTEYLLRVGDGSVDNTFAFYRGK